MGACLAAFSAFAARLFFESEQYAHLSLESLLFPCFQAFFIFKFRHILLAFCIVLWCNKYYTKRSACYVPQKNTKPEWSDSPFHC